ncbi:hypothetical protein BT96DRAFT_978952 [Gymnopus androsaceus JB14]|uniref:Cytochrome P450 n=1 Tax=Gymnopus androsaceus JB14 TaxID=1447944 RepID=A0A6A4H579_9AGAR|nr:hypothetical protein BT96DRAFT_978952 [Gymnopus androsaceus JB14]
MYLLAKYMAKRHVSTHQNRMTLHMFFETAFYIHSVPRELVLVYFSDIFVNSINIGMGVNLRPTNVPHFTDSPLSGSLLGSHLPTNARYSKVFTMLNALPTVGSSGFFSSYTSAKRFNKHAREIILEGYQKYPGQAFKIPLIDRWEVIVSGKEMIEDMKKASDMDLSSKEAAREYLQADYTLGAEASNDPYHVAVVRTPLTRNLGARFDDLRDEIVLAVEDQIPAKASEWIQVPMLYTVMKIVSRTSNRVFVGAPLCRDPDYINLNIEFTVDAMKGARTLRRYPTILKSIVCQFMTNVPTGVKRATKL